MTLTAKDLRGGAKKYAALPSYEKESIDRQFAEMTKEVEFSNESRERSAENHLKEVAKDVATHCYRAIVNPGYFQVPAKQGGNVIKERKMTDEEKRIEKIVRSIKYDLTVEAACELLEKTIKGANNVKK